VPGRRSPAASHLTLLLVDAQLPDLALLLTDLPTGVQPLLVPRQADALSLVQHWRETRGLPQQPWRLAVIGHGSAGVVRIGCDDFTAASVQARAQEWCALAPAAIDLYSCHTAADPSLAKALNASCGATIHASHGIVGHPDRGGTWTLENLAGPHPTDTDTDTGSALSASNTIVPFSRAAMAGWVHGLATFYYSTTAAGSGDGSSEDNASDSTTGARDALIANNTVEIVSGSAILSLDLNDGNDISSGAISDSSGNGYNLNLASGAVVTMTAEQHNNASAISGSGSESITLTTAASVTGEAAIESYVLANGNQTFTVSATGQNVTTGSGDVTVATGAIADLNGSTIIGTAGGTVILRVDADADISGATLTDVDEIHLHADGVDLTATIAQNALITTATGSNSVTLSDAGSTTGAAQVETYNLSSSGPNTFTLGDAAQNVNGGSAADTIDVNGLTVTGTLALAGGANVIELDNGANISSATISSSGGSYNLNYWQAALQSR